MIISDTKKFVFVHVPKTGGMSVRSVLGPHATVGVWQHKFPVKQKNPELQKHAFARTLAKYIDWDKYYSFGFVRNPWAWAVSIYFYIRKDRKDPRHRQANDMNFDRFVHWMQDWDAEQYPIVGGQKNYLSSDKGRIIVNRICRLEKFAEDFQKVCQHVGVPFKAPHKNTTTHAHYRTYYTDASRRILGKLFAEDLHTFRYKF